jgi:hypothetical protein
MPSQRSPAIPPHSRSRTSMRHTNGRAHAGGQHHLRGCFVLVVELEFANVGGDDPTTRRPLRHRPLRDERPAPAGAHVHHVPHDRIDAPLATIQSIPAASGNDTRTACSPPSFSCDGPNVHGWFCERRIDRLLRHAQSLKSTNPAPPPQRAGPGRSTAGRPGQYACRQSASAVWTSSRSRAQLPVPPLQGLIADQLRLADSSR